VEESQVGRVRAARRVVLFDLVVAKARSFIIIVVRDVLLLYGALMPELLSCTALLVCDLPGGVNMMFEAASYFRLRSIVGI